MKQVQGNKILGIAFVVSIDSDALVILNNFDVKAITEADLLDILNLWDWPKQDEAVHGMLHYLSHVEQNPEAVDRLLTFIAHHDPKHNSLDYYLGGITEQLDDASKQSKLDI